MTFGLPITNNFTVQLGYTFEQRDVQIDPALVDCVIGDSTVSRRHARVFLEPPMPGSGGGSAGQCRIEDLNSTNGTFVNGRRPAPFERVSIAPGDRVALGAIELQLSRG